MSWRPTAEPRRPRLPSPTEREVEEILTPRDRDLGGFVVRRLLPAARHRTVGPFVFFDHFGPTGLRRGRASTCARTRTSTSRRSRTCSPARWSTATASARCRRWPRRHQLDDGGARHRALRAHRARAARRPARTVHGIQLWVGLPRADEEAPPAFHHYAGETLPALSRDGVEVRVLVGEAFGRRSPVATLSRLAYVDVRMQAGATLDLPDDVADRGAYVVEGDGRLRRGARRALAHAGVPPGRPRARARGERQPLRAARRRSPFRSRATSGGTSSPAGRAHRAGQARLARAARRARRAVPAGPRRRRGVHPAARNGRIIRGTRARGVVVLRDLGSAVAQRSRRPCGDR